jgi:hypothetical protein
MLLGLEKTRLWPWQTNNFARIKGVIFAHYNDPWNLLDLTIVVFIFWHCMLSTAWNKNWDPSDGINAWLDLRPTRTEASTRPVLGMTAILGWFRCLGLMKVHPKLGPMVTITLIMFGNILQVPAHYLIFSVAILSTTEPGWLDGATSINAVCENDRQSHQPMLACAVHCYDMVYHDGLW